MCRLQKADSMQKALASQLVLSGFLNGATAITTTRFAGAVHLSFVVPPPSHPPRASRRPPPAALSADWVGGWGQPRIAASTYHVQPLIASASLPGCNCAAWSAALRR